MTPDEPGSSPSERDFVVSPLALFAAGAFIRATRRRQPVSLVVCLVAAAVEFRLPAYDRLKRSPVVPSVLRVSRSPD